MTKDVIIVIAKPKAVHTIATIDSIDCKSETLIPKAEMQLPIVPPINDLLLIFIDDKPLKELAQIFIT